MGAMLGVVPAASASAAPRALHAQGTPFGTAEFMSYGTGSEVFLNAVASGASTLANVNQAFSGVTSAGGLSSGSNVSLGTNPVLSPITQSVVQPAIGPGLNATAQGSGLEVGLGLTTAQQDQIKAGIALSASPPPSTDGTVAGPQVAAIPLSLPGLLQTGVLHGFTTTNYNQQFCPVGTPLAYGLGSAAAPTTVLTTTVASPGAAQSATRSDLIANPDGTFGLQTEVAEQIAPLEVSLPTGANTPTTITITVQGTTPATPVSLTAFTDGEGHSALTLGNADPSVTVNITLLGIALPPINASLKGLSALLNGLTGPTGTVTTALAGLGITLQLTIGNGTTAATPLPGFTNGSNAISGSYDLVALKAALGGTTIADLRLGHMEAASSLPSGSIDCTVPVAKTANPAAVTAGNTFTWNISVPSSASALNDSSCDLININVTDKIKVASGSPSFMVQSVSNGGTFDASTGTVTWKGLGPYVPGSPPIVLTVTVNVPAGSGAGVLEDTANTTAQLGNCTGGATGVATLIGPNVGNVVVTGSITLVAPQVSAAAGNGVTAPLPTTGGTPTLAWIAVLLLVSAYGTRKLLRKVRRSS
ncbi:MAG: hypothetical protein ACRDZ8_16480 [Acidimicrobiales bacterium]